MLANLRALFGSVVDIILFRRGPENLPASQTLLAIVVALSLLVSVAMSTVTTLPTSDVLLGGIVGGAVMLLWFRVALSVVNKLERFLQTMTAIFGVNTLFQPVLVPLTAALLPYFEKADANVPTPAALFLIWLFVGLWGSIVVVRIVRAAFECPWIIAILLVVGEILTANTIGSLLLGVPTKAAA